ncbi:MAG: hypothetical protein MUD08_09685 [Cytophagales bacterium]|jgi:hypothetical protein|nr:hypothetical protein [Cytophagales bacterium]
MKRIFSISTFILVCQTSQAQIIYSEVFGGHKKAQHEILISKPIDSLGIVSFFNLTYFTVDYKDRKAIDPFIYSVATFNFNQYIGIATGGYITNQGFVPIAAVSLQYFNEKGDLYLNVFPTIELTRNPNYEMFGLLVYNPTLTKKIKLFSQLTFSTNFNFKQHNFSFQQIRLGLDFRGFQFGLGCDTQIPTFRNPVSNKLETTFNPNAGVFLRKTFN